MRVEVGTQGHRKAVEELVGSPVVPLPTMASVTTCSEEETRRRWIRAGCLRVFHEGPEIERIAEGLETLLGLKERRPSADAYPAAVYETGELVLVGDKVKVKVWRSLEGLAGRSG